MCTGERGNWGEDWTPREALLGDLVRAKDSESWEICRPDKYKGKEMLRRVAWTNFLTYLKCSREK